MEGQVFGESFRDRERAGAVLLDSLYTYPKGYLTPLEKFKNGVLRVVVSDAFHGLFSTEIKRSLVGVIERLRDVEFLSPIAFTLAYACVDSETHTLGTTALGKVKKILAREAGVRFVDVVRYARYIIRYVSE
jgi:hypothetical protein